MRERGEIGEKEYDVLRRHVLWGTPLPEDVVRPATLRDDEPEPPVVATRPPAPRPPPPVVTTQPAPRPAPPRPTRRLPLLLTVVVLVLALGGAATWWFALRTDSAAAARDYAGGICADINDWRQDIVGSSEELAATLARSEPIDGQEAAVDYFASAATRTDQLTDDLGAHDADTFSGGTAYASRLATVAGQAADWFRAREQRVGDLDVRTGPIFQSVFGVITATPDQPVDTVVALVGESSAPADLNAAYDDVAICRGLQSY